LYARRLFICICLMMCPLLALTGLGAGESMRETGIFLNSREILGGERAFLFTPQEDGDYALYAMPMDNDAVCRVVCGGETLAEGPLPLEMTMQAGQDYYISIFGGKGDFEVMRLAHGRAYTRPITLTENNLRYTKSVTSPRDVHWYSFTAPEAGLYTFRTETAEDIPLDTVGYLLDENGQKIAYCDDILPRSDPNFRIFHQMEAGERVFIRVSAFSNDTGLYRLVVALPQGVQSAPEGIELAVSRAEMDIGEHVDLQASVYPENGYHDLAYSTSDPLVARVSPEGVVTAVGAGDAKITVSGYGEVWSVCRIHVRPVELTGLSLEKAEVSVAVGRTADLQPVFSPANATDRTVIYESSDTAVAAVDANGRISAISEGECAITVRSANGIEAVARVTVTPRAAVYRALVVSEYLYDDGRTRTGAVNTVQGMADMLENNGYHTTLLLDTPYDELVQGIQSAFEGAQSGDVSLFYINCHGKTEDGIGYFELHDGTRVTPYGLHALLKNVPGRIIILLDFCQSGAFLSHEGWMSPLENGKYLVLTSADPQQDSYRLGDGKTSSEAGMATVFARSLSEGGGWDLMRDRTTLQKADLNRDGRVTFTEYSLYVKGRVPTYLAGTGAVQTPRSFGEGSSLVVFAEAE